MKMTMEVFSTQMNLMMNEADIGFIIDHLFLGFFFCFLFFVFLFVIYCTIIQQDKNARR